MHTYIVETQLKVLHNLCKEVLLQYLCKQDIMYSLKNSQFTNVFMRLHTMEQEHSTINLLIHPLCYALFPLLLPFVFTLIYKGEMPVESEGVERFRNVNELVCIYT